MQTHQPHHPYHLVRPSPWPLAGAAGTLVTALGGVDYMHQGGTLVLQAGIALLIATMIGWWWDVVREAVKERVHTTAVKHGLKIGMGLFIASEVMFFAAFFWAFFHNALQVNPGISLWPPEGIQGVPTWGVPFFNTILLVSSSATLVWAMNAVEHRKPGQASAALAATVALGGSFLGYQIFEYGELAFGFTDGIYPSVFYLATGFHGFHVFVGAVFLSVCLVRQIFGHFDSGHKPVGLQAAEWYWHFVDVVWLMLFSWFYWWGA